MLVAVIKINNYVSTFHQLYDCVQLPIIMHALKT